MLLSMKTHTANFTRKKETVSGSFPLDKICGENNLKKVMSWNTWRGRRVYF